MKILYISLSFIYRAMRYAAYRQFIAWVYGRLGRRVRRVIPACVVNEIRRRFPNNPDEDYVGFRYPESD
jgi:hypothetical protein